MSGASSPPTARRCWSTAPHFIARCAKASSRRGIRSSFSAGTSTAARALSAKPAKPTTDSRHARGISLGTGAAAARLTVRLLLWDFSVLYAFERELLPQLRSNWSTPDQVQLCLDGEAPLGCSQHQKVIVVDDAVAFSGGLDLTIRRWDTSAARTEQSASRRPRRRALCALSRRAGTGGRRCRQSAGGPCARALVPREENRCRRSAARRRSLAGQRHAGFHRCTNRHLAHRAAQRQPVIREVE